MIHLRVVEGEKYVVLLSLHIHCKYLLFMYTNFNYPFSVKEVSTFFHLSIYET